MKTPVLANLRKAGRFPRFPGSPPRTFGETPHKNKNRIVSFRIFSRLCVLRNCNDNGNFQVLIMVSRRRAFVLSVLACFVSVTSWRLSPTTRSITQPYKISGYKNEHLLTVVDPRSNSRTHLVGVSHGSESSVRLVSEVISEITPNYRSRGSK